MDDAILYYVGVPCTDEVIDLITLFSIKTGEYTITKRAIDRGGFFIYPERLELETTDNGTEWVINMDAVPTVLAYYANKDFNGLCAYLNTLPERPFNVYINSAYLT